MKKIFLTCFLTIIILVVSMGPAVAVSRNKPYWTEKNIAKNENGNYWFSYTEAEKVLDNKEGVFQIYQNGEVLYTEFFSPNEKDSGCSNKMMYMEHGKHYSLLAYYERDWIASDTYKGKANFGGDGNNSFIKTYLPTTKVIYFSGESGTSWLKPGRDAFLFRVDFTEKGGTIPHTIVKSNNSWGDGLPHCDCKNNVGDVNIFINGNDTHEATIIFQLQIEPSDECVTNKQLATDYDNFQNRAHNDYKYLEKLDSTDADDIMYFFVSYSWAQENNNTSKEYKNAYDKTHNMKPEELQNMMDLIKDKHTASKLYILKSKDGLKNMGVNIEEEIKTKYTAAYNVIETIKLSVEDKISAEEEAERIANEEKAIEAAHKANVFAWNDFASEVYGDYGDRDKPFIDVFEDLDFYGKIVDVNTGKLTEKTNVVFTVITNLGMILAVLMLAIIGVKYMLGSVEEKAEYKKDLVPYLVGAILVFGISSITKLLMSIGNSINNI